MREKLIQAVRSLFRDMPDTPRNRELLEEILQNTLDRFDDLTAQGVPQSDAFTQALSGVGDVRPLWEQPAPQPKKHRVLPVVIAVVLVAVAVGAVLTAMALRDRADAGKSVSEQVEEQVERWSDKVENRVERWGERLRRSAKAAVDGDWGGFSAHITYRNAERYTAGGTELPAEGVRQLQVEWLSGTVTVEAYDGTTILVEEQGAHTADEQLRWLLEDGRLTIRYAAEGRYRGLPEKALTVRIPRSLQPEQVSVQTASADMVLREVQAAELELTTASGAAAVDGSFREASISTVSGLTVFRGICGELELETVSGDMELTLTETPGECSFESVSASVIVTLPTDRSFALEHETVSGDLTCAFAAVRTDDHTLSYTGQSGPTAELDFETVSGDVEVRMAQ